MKCLSLVGVGLLFVALFAATPCADGHGDSGSGSSGGGHSDSSGHSGGGSSHAGSSHGGGRSGHEGGGAHGDHGFSNNNHASSVSSASNKHNGVHSSYVPGPRHFEMRDFNPITGRTFRPSNSVSEPGRFHFLSETHPTERSHSHTSPGAKGWDFRRDAIFHGHHYHRYAGAWVLINDDYDPSEDFYLPPAPYEFTGEEGFSDNDSPRDAGSPDLIGIAVQTKLTRLGYYHGKIDGVLGTATRDAISAFQRDNGLRVTGYVNADLVEALKL